MNSAQMTRRSVICIGLGAMLSTMMGAAQGQKKSKRSRVAPLFPPGSECEIHLNGDEDRISPGLTRSRIVTPSTVVLLFRNMEYSDNEDAGYLEVKRVFNSLVDAKNAGDPNGVDLLVQRESVARVDVGTKARVILMHTTDRLTTPFCTLPHDRRGLRFVRLLGGQHIGRQVIIPARNLRPCSQKDTPN